MFATLRLVLRSGGYAVLESLAMLQQDSTSVSHAEPSFMGPIRICTMSEKKFAFLLFASLLLPAFSFSEPVAFKRAIELAIRNSTAINAATADTSRLQATYQEARDQYIPQVYFGSGLAYSFGFPLGEPSIFKVSSTSLLLSSAGPG